MEMSKCKKKMPGYKKIIICIISLIVIIPVSVYGYLQYKLKDVTVSSTYTSKIKEVDGITNILLLGTDGRKDETAFRTDSMIILTLDNNNKNIKLTSLARDTYVNIPGRDKGKLNTAYFWGKENLLFETIENEFGIGLDKYVIVDFTSLMDIIYALDGVELDVKDSEIKQINKFIPECYKFCKNPNKGEMKLIESSGKQTLNGYQALSYSRIRKADSAILRDGRQRKVINAIMKKYQDVSFTKYPQLIDALTPYIKTNLTSNEITSLALTGHNIIAGKSLKETLREGEFPITDEIHSKGGIYGHSGWVWVYDTNSTCVLRDFIYKNIDMKDNEYLLNNDNISLNY
ncbi:Polyisoprenyl-teichoic acid--peptidoglycan teichoic acid transferase TagU [Terrisporobacter petrolearius]